MLELRLLMFIPFAAGIFLFLLPESIKIVKGIIALIVSAVSFYLAFQIFRMETQILQLPCFLTEHMEKFLVFNLDFLSKMVVLFIGFFGAAISLYSLLYITRKKRIISYYSYYLITLGASFGAVLSDHFLPFLIFWGILAITLYKLIKGYNEESSSAAKKSLILIGASDSFLILGIAILWKMTGTLRLSAITISPEGTIGVIAFISLLITSLAKAGAFPLHTWVPQYAKCAPASSSAFLPASLDKLLGIYFLARIFLNLFIMQNWMNLVLLITGGITIIAAVMMALIQHNMKRLLSYHAVSQVGYMVIGIGTANPIGIAGGLFHMLNHAIYKCVLFLSAGSVEKEVGTTDLDKLGGVAHFMPISFLCCLVGSLAISGIPPLNGFASKWMIYQGIVELGREGSKLWVVWLTAAMFGSALTLASFKKLLHATFLGQQGVSRDIKEVPVSMWLPMSVLAVLCIVFGIFAFILPLKHFIIPAIGGGISYIGLWQPGLATVLVLAGLTIGVLIYFLGTLKTARASEPFIGGETLPLEERPTGTEFYNTITDIPLLGSVYKFAKEGLFDIYELGRKVTFGFSGLLQYLHNGVLSTYLAWCLLGMLLLFIILMRGVL